MRPIVYQHLLASNYLSHTCLYLSPLIERIRRFPTSWLSAGISTCWRGFVEGSTTIEGVTHRTRRVAKTLLPGRWAVRAQSTLARFSTSSSCFFQRCPTEKWTSSLGCAGKAEKVIGAFVRWSTWTWMCAYRRSIIICWSTTIKWFGWSRWNWC